ncbi:hypothetical protein [Morganella morganii]|uniref:hypothetical protein n=1 Tax=Morganella morganii TaxID=582 RepID=UPI0023601A9A|nr:hypothetical protein [Morganella morganii]EGT3623133.1 hypothetical protein [Morganella morganii]EGT3629846.1 hypothetical protein [Morganella morganii]EGT3633320.1 hypothetical protein [Morganella morganii]
MTKLSVLTGVVLLAAGLFPAAVSASSTPAEPVCKETVRDPESYDSTDECYYKDSNLVQTYGIYRSTTGEPKNLAEKLTPGTDRAFTDYGDTVSLEYKWQGNNHLTVTQLFNGGLDTITFEDDGQGTRVITAYSPD